MNDEGVCRTAPATPGLLNMGKAEPRLLVVQIVDLLSSGGFLPIN